MDNRDKINYERYLEKLPKLKALLTKEELIEVEKFQIISQSLQIESFEGEEWVYFRNTNKLYSISSYSRIRRNSGDVATVSGNTNFYNTKIIKQNKQKGYCHTMISVNNNQISFRVHRELAIHFIANPLNLPMANHKTGIRDDNRISNIEWSDNSNNQLQSYLQLRKPSRAMKDKKGALSPNSQKVFQCDENWVIIKEWDSIADAARFFNINASAISFACKKGTESTGYYWKYSGVNKNLGRRKGAVGGRKTIIQYDLNGNFIREWESAAKAAKSLGGFGTLIAKVCRGKSNTSYGFKWGYKDVV